MCGFHLNRDEPGYWLGSYTINIFLTETVFVVAFVGGLFLTWPTPPWQLLLYLSIALMVACPFLFFPHSKTLYLAVDLMFRPARPEDLATPIERQVGVPKAPAGRVR